MKILYLVLNLAVLLALTAVVYKSEYKFVNKKWCFTLIVLLIVTAIFDSLIIAAKIVAYDQFKILGIYIGRAPIEDFAYTIAAMLLMPLLWNRFRKDK